MKSKTFSRAAIAIAVLATLAGCSSSDQGTRVLPWDKPIAGANQSPTQAQKNQVTKEFMKQGNGKIRKPGTSGFIGFGQIK